ncbi:MAG TPA: hypothetical protein VFT66_11275 [Roseiflexaceae bacterium]|jgi:hypothetical protein|nr:hypothetical protein [Roseiflexaceae bacterium]
MPQVQVPLLQSLPQYQTESAVAMHDRWQVAGWARQHLPQTARGTQWRRPRTSAQRYRERTNDDQENLT